MFSMFKKNRTQYGNDFSGPIFPRIKTPLFLRAISQVSGVTEDQMPVAAELAGDLLLTFAIDIGPSFVAVTHAEMAKRNLNIESMYAEALKNAGPLFSHMQIKTNGTIHQIETGNDMEACSMLIASLWNDIEKDIGDAPIAIFPHRNAAFFSGKNTPGGLSGLQEILTEVDFNETHALSESVFIWNGSGWNVLDSRPYN